MASGRRSIGRAAGPSSLKTQRTEQPLQQYEGRDGVSGQSQLVSQGQSAISVSVKAGDDTQQLLSSRCRACTQPLMMSLENSCTCSTGLGRLEAAHLGYLMHNAQASLRRLQHTSLPLARPLAASLHLATQSAQRSSCKKVQNMHLPARLLSNEPWAMPPA